MIYFLLYLLGLLSFFLVWAVGYFIVCNHYFNLVGAALQYVRCFVGLIVVVSFYAIWKTNGVTFSIIIVPLVTSFLILNIRGFDFSIKGQWRDVFFLLSAYTFFYAGNNAHLFYILAKNVDERDRLINFLKTKNIHCVFHYLSLHRSPFYTTKHDGRVLENCDRYAETLVRLPFYFELERLNQMRVIQEIIRFFCSE